MGGKKVRVYGIVRGILEKYPQTRNSDKELIWQYWADMGFVNKFPLTTLVYVNRANFFKTTSFETITRIRRMLQAKHPELKANKVVSEKREEKETTKGTFVYREKQN